MIKKTKTYGVYGLMEWVAVIPTGSGNVHVHFTDGSVSGFGVTPAEYTTDNGALQAIIETSPHFMTGKIRLLNTVETEYEDPFKPQTNDDEPSKVELPKKPSGSGVKKVNTVKTLDDAAAYFAENYGAVFSDESEMKELMEQYKVQFPKYKS